MVTFDNIFGTILGGPKGRQVPQSPGKVHDVRMLRDEEPERPPPCHCCWTLCSSLCWKITFETHSKKHVDEM
ncbi:Hypothetical predicted protein [Scomber scombrus]|uniref:Uncharacterized protein n=1 Tax=Scomber scombrus TaxID=13677 RepID=A0AAV1PD24_SCOSC